MRMAGVPYAVATYEIPPHPPAPVAEAKVQYDTIATRWADTREALQDAKEALAEAKAADIRAVVEAATGGKDVDDPRCEPVRWRRTLPTSRYRFAGSTRRWTRQGTDSPRPSPNTGRSG